MRREEGLHSLPFSPLPALLRPPILLTCLSCPPSTPSPQPLLSSTTSQTPQSHASSNSIALTALMNSLPSSLCLSPSKESPPPPPLAREGEGAKLVLPQKQDRADVSPSHHRDMCRPLGGETVKIHLGAGIVIGVDLNRSMRLKLWACELCVSLRSGQLTDSGE